MDNRVVLALVLAGLLSVAALFANVASMEDLPSGFTYIIKSDSGTYTAIKYTGEISAQSTDSATVFSAVAAEGVSVLLRDGSYNVNASWLVNFDDFKLKGESQVGTVLYGGAELGIYSVIRINGTRSNLEFSDFTVDGTYMNHTASYVTGRKGFHSTNEVNHLYLHDVTVHDTPATGIGLDYLLDSVIENCYVYHCGTTGHSDGSNGIGVAPLGQNSRSSIRDNVVKDCFNDGILLEQVGVGGWSSGWTVTGNQVSGCGGGGTNPAAIRLDGIRNSVVHGNILLDNKHGIDVTRCEWESASEYSKDLVISDNIIKNSWTHGVRVINGASSNITISNNDIRGNLGWGVYGNSSTVYVLDNSIFDNGSGGVSGGAGGTPVSKRNYGFVTENSFSGANTTSITAVLNHGCSGTLDYAWVSFSDSAITGYTWSSTSTQITVTPVGTLPASWTCYVRAEYIP